MSNFISNAIRHSYKSQTINIYLKKENDIVTFSIKNIGDKIPSEKLSKIWNRFYRVEESRTKEDGGTGLGLAIAKNILDLHGSDFGVRNIDNGVEFFFNIKAGKEC
jgi:signal transduction histidine kinase